MNTWFPAGGSVWEVVDLLRDGILLKSLVLGFVILLSQWLISASMCVHTLPSNTWVQMQHVLPTLSCHHATMPFQPVAVLFVEDSIPLEL